jgi:hypothetical protein
LLFARRARFRDGTRRAVRKAMTAARRIGLCSWEAQSEAWPRVGRFGDGWVQARNGKSTAKGTTRFEMSVSCITIAYSHAVRISYVKQGERVLAQVARCCLEGARVKAAGLRMRDSADEMRHSPRNI